MDENRDYAQVLAEIDGSGAPTVQYSYGDDLISQNRGAAAHFYHYDGLGSTRALSDTTGALTDTYDYAAFGELLQSTGTTANAYRFTGEQYDGTLNQYYLRARYYDQSVGRFTQMDTFQGVMNQPVTLHKYLYGNADPANVVDPSGNFGLVSFGIANNIRTELSLLQIDAGTSLLDAALSGDSASPASAAGFGIIASLAPSSLKFISKSFISKFIGKGKVSYLKNKKPLDKEISAAEFLAANHGARIFIRGGKSAKGADFFLDGKLWELKTLDAATNNAVFNSIRTALKKGQSKRVIIDGREVGLTRNTLLDGIARAQRNGRNPNQVRAILKDGSLFEWP